jgi:hypothetical protein
MTDASPRSSFRAFVLQLENLNLSKNWQDQNLATEYDSVASATAKLNNDLNI